MTGLNRLVLASASPRRRELLAQAGFTFDVISADVPEIRKPGEDPIRFVTRLAREKAEAVRRARKLARKKMQREGLLPMKPKPTLLGAPAR